jgi:hypothetical protein
MGFMRMRFVRVRFIRTVVFALIATTWLSGEHAMSADGPVEKSFR